MVYSGKRKVQIVSVLGNIYLERECMFVRTKGKGLKEMDGLVSVFSVGKAIYRHYFKLYWTWQKQHPRVIWHCTLTKYFLLEKVYIYILIHTLLNKYQVIVLCLVFKTTIISMRITPNITNKLPKNIYRKKLERHSIKQ